MIYNIRLYIKPTHYTVVYSSWILHKIVIYQYTVIDHYTAISKIRYSIFKSHLLEWSAALSSKGNQGLLEKWLQCSVREKRPYYCHGVVQGSLGCPYSPLGLCWHQNRDHPFILPGQGREFQLSRDTAVQLTSFPLGHSEFFDCSLNLLSMVFSHV